MSRSPESSPTSRSARIGLGVVGCVHAGLAAAWMQAMAGGFGLVHRMSLANRWAPGLLLVMGLGAAVAAVLGSARWARVGVLGALGTWVGIGVAAPWVFPTSAGLRWLLLALAGGTAAWIVHAESIARRLLALAPGVGAGAAMVWAQRSPEPSTRPAGGELMEVAPSRCDWDGTVKFALGHGVQVAANGLLVFESVSPDRSWTALAPGDRWRGLEPRCVAHQLGEREIRARFAAEGEAALVVRVDEATATMSIDATTRLPEPVYSHLNHAFQATLTGNDLWITAAPCPEQPWQPLSRDGPGDFAYIDADGRFVLARTSSEEKGPFEERCRGTAPQGPVELWVHAGDRLAGRILLHDWATQADRSPSPTAGWGVSANAIEVWRASPTSLHLSASLSVTSIGRGWHAVGHAAGTYRSRVELVALP